MDMQWAHRTRRTEIIVAWVVALGVACIGIYDFAQGSAPSGVFDLPVDLRLGLFIIACPLAAGLATRAVVTAVPREHAGHRAVILATSAAPAVLADPTYASLVLAVPLIDIRRRDAEPTRSALTLFVIGLIGFLLMAEDTPLVVAEIEAIFALSISFFIIVMFGDALGQLDRGLLAETELAQLRERSRLTSELHDSVGHHLLAASVQLRKASAIGPGDPDASSQAVDFASQAVADAISETRMIVDASQQGRGFEVESAIQDLTKRIVPASTTVTVATSGDHSMVNPLVQIALYRVVQESLSNIVRHSSAATARVESNVADDLVQLQIIDDGAGFDTRPGRPGTGVDSMRRRVEDLGGSFDITSVPGQTVVRATVPT